MKELKFIKIAEKWQAHWSNNSYFKWNKNLDKDKNFSIDTPPPTVSGKLHIGHVFSYAHIDFIARYQRAIGKNVYFPIGFDDNGLPTEKLVEKIKKVKASKIKRSYFIELCNLSIKTIEDYYKNVFKKLGISFDWKQKYQTISNKSSIISQMSFIDLYKKKIIKRKKEPCFWDIQDQTSISQSEIKDSTKYGVLYNIIFTLTNKINITISTSRPEMISSCVAILFHPNDLRYRKLSNKIAIVPIFNYRVKIIADKDVDMAKGTGIVMCSTFGDIQDTIWWRRHKLKIKSCIDKHGRMKNASLLNTLTINDARRKIVKELNNKIIFKEQTEQKIKMSERSGSTLEIILTPQWYIQTLNIKKHLKKINNKINWYPKYMKVRLDNWINGLNQNWCISRQRYYGIPIPIWYSLKGEEKNKIIVPNKEELPVEPMSNTPPSNTK